MEKIGLERLPGRRLRRLSALPDTGDLGGREIKLPRARQV
jgi:hypothetical protein